MKKAINIDIFPADTPYESIFAALRAAGFAGAELNMFDKKKDFPSLWEGADESELKAVADCAAQQGIEIVGVVSAAFWTYKLSSDDAQERARATELLQKLDRKSTRLNSSHAR